MYNILIWCMRISQNLDSCDCPLQIFFLAPNRFFFSDLTLSPPFAFHFLSGCRKKLGVNNGKNLEMGSSSIIGIIGHSINIFAPKLIKFFIRSISIYSGISISRTSSGKANWFKKSGVREI